MDKDHFITTPPNQIHELADPTQPNVIGIYLETQPNLWVNSIYAHL